MVPIPIDLKGLVTDWCKRTEPIDIPIHLSEKEIRKESRKIFDKLVIRIIKNKIDNQILADEILKLDNFPERYPIYKSFTRYDLPLYRMTVDNYSVFYIIQGSTVLVTNVLYSASNLTNKL